MTLLIDYPIGMAEHVAGRSAIREVPSVQAAVDVLRGLRESVGRVTARLISPHYSLQVDADLRVWARLPGMAADAAPLEVVDVGGALRYVEHP